MQLNVVEPKHMCICASRNQFSHAFYSFLQPLLSGFIFTATTQQPTCLLIIQASSVFLLTIMFLSKVFLGSLDSQFTRYFITNVILIETYTWSIGVYRSPKQANHKQDTPGTKIPHVRMTIVKKQTVITYVLLVSGNDLMLFLFIFRDILAKTTSSPHRFL